MLYIYRCLYISYFLMTYSSRFKIQRVLMDKMPSGLIKAQYVSFGHSGHIFKTITKTKLDEALKVDEVINVFIFNYLYLPQLFKQWIKNRMQVKNWRECWIQRVHAVNKLIWMHLIGYYIHKLNRLACDWLSCAAL